MTESSKPQDAEERPRPSLISQWPMLAGMLLIWGSLWQSFAIGNMIMGLLVSLLIMWFYRLPRIPFNGRFNLWHAIVFTIVFLYKIMVASIRVAYDAIFIGPRIVNSVVAVKLRSHDDLVVTLTGHALALIPGSLVIDVDRPSATLYLHCLDISNDSDVQKFKDESLRIEAYIIRAIGSQDEYALVKAQDQAKDGVVRYREESEVGEQS